MKYINHIDGLRALAVIGVVLFHLKPNIVSGGFAGVDVFFVISGYLITSKLLEINTADDFLSFYIKRIKRIIPALYIMLIVLAPITIFMLPSEMNRSFNSYIAIPLFAANFLYWKTSGYFEASQEENLYLNTWSLSVEEQFYILFPLSLILLLKKIPKYSTLIIILLLTSSFITAQYLSEINPEASFYLPITRAWEFLLGTIAALNKYKFSNFNSKLNGFLFVFGFLLILTSYFAFDDRTLYPSFYTLAPCIGAVLVIVFPLKTSVLYAFLISRYMAAVGLSSYSIYLWHQPIFALFNHFTLGSTGIAILAIKLILLIFIVYLSYNFVEKRFRYIKRVTNLKAFVIYAVSTVIIVSIGILGKIYTPLVSKFITGYNNERNLQRFDINYGLNQNCDKSFNDTKLCQTDFNPEVLVWGDSFAMHLVHGFVSSNPEIKLIQKTISYCGPVIGIAPYNRRKYGLSWAKNCIQSNDQVLDYITKSKSLKYVVVSSPFDQYLGSDAEFINRSGDTSSDHEFFYMEFYNTLELIRKAGKEPIIFAPTVQNYKFNTGLCLRKASYWNQSLSSCDFKPDLEHSDFVYISELISKMATNFRVVNMKDMICTQEKCLSNINDTYIYRDASHLSKEGSAYLGTKYNFYQVLKK